MKKNNRKLIGYKNERVVLSDILPYEVPPFFTNRYFYNFLTLNKVKIYNDELRFKKESTNTLEKLIRIIFGIDYLKPCVKSHIDYDFFILKDKSYITIPFKFKITHKDNDFRELTVIHPINQLLLVSFYNKYKYSILNCSDLSRFSLRKPAKISYLKYFKDNTNKKNTSKYSEIEIIETSDKEYTSLKTFFSYKKYSNIYQFYESYDYQKAEKSFDSLLKFDISRCFDSIYTHSFVWALSNKKIVKDNISEAKESFGGQFDKLMQQMNYNETNGIVIGPEFSRIFAEIILQKIDKNVEKALYNKGIKYKENYDIFRYVDDYFVFYSDENIKKEILNLYKINLQEYNLFFNESKTEIFPKPIITNITIAKEEIRKLVECSMIFNLNRDDYRNQIGIRYYTAKDIITNYKLILSNTKTSYKDLQNYFLSIIFNKQKDSIKVFQNEQKKLLNLYLERRVTLKRIDTAKKHDKKELEEKLVATEDEILLQKKIMKSYHNQLHKNFIEIIDLTFFIYSVLPRVTYSIKVCHILFRIIDFIKNQEKSKQIYLIKNPLIENDEDKYIGFDFDIKHTIYKKIYDGIAIVFKKTKSSIYAEVETLYLLPIINELGSNYSLDESLLINHFNIVNDKSVSNCNLNYFTIISILNYIKRETKYNNIRSSLQEIISKKFSIFEKNHAEAIFLLIDILTCPFIASSDTEAKDFRRKILDEIKFFESNLNVADKDNIIENIESFNSNWFYKWKDYDLGIELNTKRGHSVY